MARRFDKYDIAGLILLGLVVALWMTHFLLPPAPPLPPA
jgi:hypothetical protein